LPGFNKVILCGNLTDNPKQHETSGGTMVSEFVCAVDNPHRWVGRGKHETAFVLVKCFGKLAVAVVNNRRVGDLVLVEGHLTTECWVDAEGQNKQRMFVTAESIQFLPRSEQSQQPQADEFVSFDDLPEMTTTPF